MAKITWDDTGKRFYETGVDRGVLYPLKSDGTYDKGVAWNGLTSVSESPEGAEPTDLWADNIKYATLYSAETFGGTIEAYTFPDEFAKCDGSYTPVDGVYFGQQERQAFGFCYRTKVGNDVGLDSYKLHLIYNAKASPSEKSYETVNDSPDAITMSWEITTVAVPVEGKDDLKPLSTIIIDKSKLDSDGLTALATLENTLYGTNAGDNVTATEPTLPTPAQVLGMFK